MFDDSCAGPPESKPITLHVNKREPKGLPLSLCTHRGEGSGGEGTRMGLGVRAARIRKSSLES